MEKRLAAILKETSGVTLLEALLTIAMLSVVILSATSLYLFSQNQYTLQSEQIFRQQEIRLALSMISRDIRNENLVSIPEKNVLVIGNPVEGTRYERSGTRLMKNGKSVADHISGYTVIGLDDNGDELITAQPSEIAGIKLHLISTPDRTGSQKTLETTIYVRK